MEHIRSNEKRCAYFFFLAFVTIFLCMCIVVHCFQLQSESMIGCQFSLAMLFLVLSGSWLGSTSSIWFRQMCFVCLCTSSLSVCFCFRFFFSSVKESLEKGKRKIQPRCSCLLIKFGFFLFYSGVVWFFVRKVNVRTHTRNELFLFLFLALCLISLILFMI